MCIGRSRFFRRRRVGLWPIPPTWWPRKAHVSVRRYAEAGAHTSPRGKWPLIHGGQSVLGATIIKYFHVISPARITGRYARLVGRDRSMTAMKYRIWWYRFKYPHVLLARRSTFVTADRIIADVPNCSPSVNWRTIIRHTHSGSVWYNGYLNKE